MQRQLRLEKLLHKESTVEKEKIDPAEEKSRWLGAIILCITDSLFKCDLKKFVFSLYGPFTKEQNEECR